MKTDDGELEITGVTPLSAGFDPETGAPRPSDRYQVAAQSPAGVRHTLTVVSDDPSRVEAHAAGSPLHHWQKEG